MKKLEPPQKQNLTGEAYWSWLHKLWFRTTAPGQISGAQIAFSGTNVVLGHGTSANPAGQEFSVVGSAPVNVAFGTSSIIVSHNTSGVASGTYGGATVIPQVVVNTFGHVTAVNTFGLTGTAVTGADISLTSPIVFASGTGTNAVLRAVSIAHATSGVTPGTYGGTAGALQIVVNTYGHVTAAVGTAAFPSGATWQTNKQTVESGESLTIDDNYQILFGGQFFINGTGAVTVNGTAGGLYIH